MAYRPAIGQINFTVAPVENIQNTDNLDGAQTPFQPSDQGVSPLAVAQYMLYDREQEDNGFGLDEPEYLGHKGGFLTQGDKINIKSSPLLITGTLTVRQKANFYKNIDITFRSIVNSQRRGSITTEVQTLRFVDEVYRSSLYDYTAMTVGDVREFSYVKGMIIPFVGTFTDLFTQLPYWRLCGPPDAGKVINDVTVPNLVGKFILGGGYTNVSDEQNNTGTNTYQPKDNADRNFGSQLTLNIGFQGGNHARVLTLAEMPLHNHNVRFAIEGGISTITSSRNEWDLYVGGGTVSLGTLRTAKDQCAYNFVFSNCKSSDCNNSCTRSGSYTCSYDVYGGGQSAVSLAVTPPTYGNIGVNDRPVTPGGVSNSIIFVGDDQPHNNIPPYYALGYIIYVGKDRGQQVIPPGVLYPPISRNTSNSMWFGFGASTTTFANQHWVYDTDITSLYDEVSRRAFLDNTSILNDSAIVNDNIRLTTNIQGAKGNAFYNKRIAVRDAQSSLIDWQVYFSFSMGGGAGTGDGLSFIFHNNGASAPLGGTTFGYVGVIRGYAVIIDTRTSAPRIMLCEDGSDVPITSANITNFNPTTASQEKRYVWVTYSKASSVLRVYLNNINVRPTQPIISNTINILSKML